jgi:hypothetical protein
MDTTAGLRVGSGSSPSFSVAMDGSLTASNATISKSSGSNTIILDATSFRMVGSAGTTTLDYNSNITLSSTGNVFTGGGSYVSLLNSDSSTELWPGGIKYFQGPIFGSAAVSYNQYLYNNQWVTYATGLTEITWANFYINSAPPYNYPSAQVWTRLGDDFRPLGITPFGAQLLGPRMFSGTATSNSTINTDLNARTIAPTSINGDFYFSTA